MQYNEHPGKHHLASSMPVSDWYFISVGILYTPFGHGQKGEVGRLHLIQNKAGRVAQRKRDTGLSKAFLFLSKPNVSQISFFSLGITCAQDAVGKSRFDC